MTRLDIRLPIGLLFTVFGGALMIAGVASDTFVVHRVAAASLNLWWGGAMGAFGALMLWLARRG